MPLSNRLVVYSSFTPDSLAIAMPYVTEPLLQGLTADVTLEIKGQMKLFLTIKTSGEIMNGNNIKAKATFLKKNKNTLGRLIFKPFNMACNSHSRPRCSLPCCPT
jgi:hypothetical protein